MAGFSYHLSLLLFLTHNPISPILPLSKSEFLSLITLFWWLSAWFLDTQPHFSYTSPIKKRVLITYHSFLVVIGVAIFMVQNSTAPPVMMKFLFWNFKTLLTYTILVSVGSSSFSFSGFPGVLRLHSERKI
jgi:uncharacterized integral membrane protein